MSASRSRSGSALDRGSIINLWAVLSGRATVEVPLCEHEPTLAESMARDVALLLGPKVRVRPVVTADPGSILTDAPEGPVLFAPRVWDGLPLSAKRDPRAVEVRYVFRAADIEAIAIELGWP